MQQDTMLTHLADLQEGLSRKEQALLDILAITTNQRTTIDSVLPLDDIRRLVFDMNTEKQDAIRTVVECDGMFEAMLATIGAELELRQKEFPKEVGVLQAQIARVMSLDAKIRETEDENNKRLDAKRERDIPVIKPKPAMPVNTTRVISAYQDSHANFKG